MFKCDLSKAEGKKFGTGTYYRETTGAYCIVGLLAECCGQLGEYGGILVDFADRFNEVFKESPSIFGENHFDDLAERSDNSICKDQKWARRKFDRLIEEAKSKGLISLT